MIEFKSGMLIKAADGSTGLILSIVGFTYRVHWLVVSGMTPFIGEYKLLKQPSWEIL